MSGTAGSRSLTCRRRPARRSAGCSSRAAGAARGPAGRGFAAGAGIRAWRRGTRPLGRFVEARPVPATAPDKFRHLGSRHTARVHARIGEAAGVHPGGFVPHRLEQFLQAVALAVSYGEPARDFIPAGAQPAYCQRSAGKQVCVHAEDRVDDAIDDQAPRARRLVVPDHRAEVLRPDSLTARICRRRGITHAELVSIGKSDPGPGLRQLAEELPGDRGLPDARRAAEPQDRDYAARH